MARQLRPVPNGAADQVTDAEPEAAKTVLEAASGGKRLELLNALQNRIATAIDNPKTPARDLAALTNRSLEIAEQIEAIRAASGAGGRKTAVASTGNEAWNSEAI